MIWAVPAVIGAAIAIAVKESIEHYEEVRKKRANCYHLWGETRWDGNYGTRWCTRCGTQQHINKDREPL